MTDHKKKILIFDMDGVLFDTIPFAKKIFMERHPGVAEEIYNELHSGNFHEEASKYLHLQIKETEEEKNKFYLDYSDRKSKSNIFQGIKELLEELHSSGYLLAMNTNAYERNCLPLLENSGIRGLFDFIAAVEASKDKVEKFKLIGKKYNADPNQLLFITDALGDVRDADSAGVPTVAVTWGVHDKKYFEREKHSNLVAIIDTVEDLGNFIKKYQFLF
jgi:phosphoglycolate phosphatase